LFYGEAHYARMIGPGFDNYASGFSSAFAYASQGHDAATFFDSTGDDLFYGEVHYARMIGSGYDNFASGFSSAVAYATQGGSDTAQLYGSAADDYLRAVLSLDQLPGESLGTATQGFEHVRTYSATGGEFDSLGTGERHDVWTDDSFDLAVAGFAEETDDAEIEAIDLLFEEIGVWD